MGIFFKLFKKKNRTSVNNVCAVIVAAGNSTRMKLEGQSKQFLSIDGIPVIGHTLRAYELSKNIADIVVVARSEDLVDIGDIAKQLNIRKLRKVVAGGEFRCDSVKNGIAEVPPSTRFIAIADGARPLVKPDKIDEAVAAAVKYGGAALACPVRDTLKRVDISGNVLSTVERSGLYNVQTPQVFDIIKYNAALSLCKDDNYTDDCQYFEKCGFTVHIVQSDATNIKITYKEDIALAQSILEAQRCIE